MPPLGTEQLAGCVVIDAATQSAVTVIEAVAFPDPRVSGSVAVIVDLPAAFAVALNVALAALAGIVTLAGTVTAAVLLDRSDTTVLRGTFGVMVMVNACTFPTVTIGDAGVSEIVGFVTVTVAVALLTAPHSLLTRTQ